MPIKKIHPIVIKYGGSIVSNNRARKRFFKQMKLIIRSQNLLLVHGGGAEISAYISRLGINPRFVGGLRYTDTSVMEAVEMVLSGKVNKDLVSNLMQAGIRAAGISARDGQIIIAKKIAGLGRVGKPYRVKPKLLNALMAAGFVPVVSPVGSDAAGKPLNINADDAAGAIAIAMKARRLIYMTDVPGILDNRKKTIHVIHANNAQQLIHDHVVTGGMIPKLLAASHAVAQGVAEVDIVQGTDTSFEKGTRIIP
ncbi:MAG: acetylglutamate kinase [Elusimicrobia bacterium]|nr:acetylglutamate kinase [Elusimicrobiota bacterium]MBD3411747.1 acetylglutamate kinase [Elusimicrobiota bacterium]